MNLVGYVTLAEANNYIETRYLSSDPLRETWDGMSDEDKTVCLMRSLDAIESLPYVGHKMSATQLLAFPRCPQTEVPENVKRAQIENALCMSDTSNDEDSALYDKLWRYGIESYTIGNLRETSVDGTWGRSRAGGAHGLASAKAYALLTPYMQGGYRLE